MLPHLITNIINIGQFETINSFNQMSWIVSWCLKIFWWIINNSLFARVNQIISVYKFEQTNQSKLKFYQWNILISKNSIMSNGQQWLNVAYQTHCTLFFVWPRSNIFLSKFWLVIWMSTELGLQYFEYFASRLRNYKSIQNILYGITWYSMKW